MNARLPVLERKSSAAGSERPVTAAVARRSSGERGPFGEALRRARQKGHPAGPEPVTAEGAAETGGDDELFAHAPVGEPLVEPIPVELASETTPPPEQRRERTQEARLSGTTRTRRTTTDTALAPGGLLSADRLDGAAASGADEPVAQTVRVRPSQLPETVVEQAGRTPQVLRVRLTPPHLGEVEVVLRSRGGSLQLAFRCQTGAAAASLRGQVSILRRALLAQGFTLGRCQITSARPQPGAGPGKPQPFARPHKRGNS